MAKNNEVMAKVRVTIGGVEASRKNLNLLQKTADELSEKLVRLNKQKLKFVDENNVKGADAVVKEMNKVNASLKLQKQMIKAQEAELNNYSNILDNLTNTRLTDLQKGLRDLQAQMKQTLTMNDVKKYSELKAAYDQLLSSIEQLSGKVPNISYVLKNVGNVADKTLADSIGYMEKLIASTDKTTKRGRENIKQWTADLKAMREEMASRSIKVLENPQHYSVEAIQQAVASLKKLQPTLRLSSTEWDNYSQKIKEAEQYLKSYDEKQKQLAEKAMRQQTDKVLANPAGFSQQEVEEAIKNAEKLQKTYTVGSPWWIHYKNGIDAAKLSLDSFNQKQKEADELARKKTTERVLADPTATGVSEQAILDAIKHGKELQKQLEYGSDEWKKYAQDIKFAEDYLKSYDAEQRRLMETQKAQAAIQNAASAKTSAGTFNLTKDEAKEAAETIEKYINTLNMSTQADEIKQATDALNIYNKALGKVKDASVDVSAILNDPKLFSSSEIEQGIKQLEEAGKAIAVGDSSAIQQNVDNINKLKAALAEGSFDENWIQNVVKDATNGAASIQDMEKAVALIKEKMRRTTDKTVMEKLRQDLDKLNPALDATKFNLERVQKTLGNIKGANLGSLKEAAERLKQELNDVNLNMDDFAEKATKLKEVNQQIKELEAQTKNVSSAWDNAVSRLKNWVLIYAGSSEIWNKMVESYRGVLKLSDAMSDVRKVTGLTNDEVRLLTDQVQELDTRISNEKLMQAAVEAGRIGLKTREEVLQFTRASSITLTALDELDARAITSVMKLNGLLGETARLGVQQAILSTASSINELSMASSAAQQPIIDFSRRFGGIAAQANISTAEVLGLGATIDALGQPIEMSSTALNKFTTALLSNGKAIAEDTGLSEDYIFEMTRQGKTIELMIEVLGKLNNMGGIGEISKYMGDMGGDGARMTAVISALAANLGFLRQNLDLSKQSFEEGISVINEYNIKNENAAALVERIVNEVKEAFVNSQFVEIVTAIVRGLQQLIHFMFSGTEAANWFNKALMFLGVSILSCFGSLAKFNTAMRTWINTQKQATINSVTFLRALINIRGGFIAMGAALKGGWANLKAWITGTRVATTSTLTFWGAVNKLKNGLLALFAVNPVGWLALLGSLIMDLLIPAKKLEEQVENTGSAMDRVNEAFEEEAYKLTKIREKLNEVNDENTTMEKKSSIMSEVISTLNREYSDEIGYVIDLAAGQRELAAAIDLATISMRKQLLEQEKAKVGQNVRNEYREQTNAAQAALKESLQAAFGKRTVGGEDITQTGLRDLYQSIMSSIVETSTLNGVASVDERVEDVLRTQAKAKSGGNKDLEDMLVKQWSERLKGLTAVDKVIEIYSKQATEINNQTEDINRDLIAQTKLQNKSYQTIVEELNAGDDLLKKAPESFTASDENQLKGIIDTYNNMLKNIDQATNPVEWLALRNKMKDYEYQRNEVLRAYVENPLRGIKMKVGEDGKLYKELTKDGRIQYEAVQEMSDANLEVLRQNYIRAENTFQQLMSDYNHKMDSNVKTQAENLSKVKTAIKTYLNKNGITIDDKGNLKLRDTEYRDGSSRTSRQKESEMRKAYQALLNNLKEYYDKKKQLVLDDYLHDKATAEEKNLRLESLEREHKEAITAMINELLGETEDLSIFDEDTLIRDKDKWTRVLDWILKDTHHFQDQVRADREALEKENLESMVKYKEERARIILGNDYQAQVDREMQNAFEKADLFWFGLSDKTASNADAITAVLKEAAKDAYSVESSELIARLQLNRVFGQNIKSMTAEQQQALVILLQQFHDKTIEADKKFADQRRKITQQMWESGGYENEYNSANASIKDRQENLGLSKDFGAKSDRMAYEEQYRLTLEQWALEEWKFQMQYELAIKAGETEEQLLARRMEMAEMEKEMQRQVTEAYMTEYDRRAEKMSAHAQKLGDFAGVMASAAWNSVEDRKKAGEELLKYIAQETSEYIRELLVRKIKEEVLRRQGLTDLKKGEEEKHNIEQKGVDTSIRITEIGGKLKTGIEEQIAGNVSSIAESTAAQGASLAVKKAQVDSAAGAASGAAKTIGELGWWGIPLIAAINDILSMLLNMAFGALSSSFGKSASTSKSSKRLATGMLTYASGRYPTLGDDGCTYDAQYEPTLRTGIYDGGKGKAHMALFSEIMPEMVVSGRTTKIIQEDFPGLMNAILMIDKYGTLPQQRRVRRYAGGNVDDFDVEMVQDEDGVYHESPAISELRQSNQELREAVAALTEKLSNPIPVFLNMYGPGGVYESMDKANKFYQKNRIKNS